MGNLNKVQIEGFLCRDPELKYLQNGSPLSVFSIGCNRSVKKGEAWEDVAMFFDCQAFGETGKKIANDFRKGSAINVIGQLRQDRWQDRDGNNRSKVIINVTDACFPEWSRQAKAAAAGETYVEVGDKTPASEPPVNEKVVF